MVRGYQKRIIHLKNTESDAFDEAFFLVSEMGGGMCERELIAEANRILDESVYEGKGKKSVGVGDVIKRLLPPFMLGSITTSIIWILLTIV